MSSEPRGALPEPAATWDYEALRQLLTAERLGSYAAASGGGLRETFRLYEWNMRASAAVMTTTAMVEVVVRNALDEQLTAWAAGRSAGPWFDSAPLDSQALRDITKARERATRRGRDHELHGKVVAELTLGFWRFLTASRYLTSLWVPALHKAFPHGPADLRRRRQGVEQRLQQLAFVRNRAAHHEPVHRRDLTRDADAAVELVTWVSQDAGAWVAARSPVGAAVAERKGWTTVTG